LIGFVSTLFWVYTFYSESIFGHGVLFIEPNRPLAFFELSLVVVGAILLCACMVGGVLLHNPTEHKDDDPEPNGYPRSGIPYQ